MTNGHFVRDNHMVKSSPGTYGGETIFWWDAKDEVLKYHYFDTSGGMSSGVMRQTENGFVAPDETYEGQDGSKMVIRAQWNIKSDYQYLMESLKVSGDATTRMFAIDYHKAPLADCPGPGCSR